MLLISAMSGAQTLKGSYFLDNSLNRHKLNPAFAPQSSYFQLPFIGSTSLGVYSNMELSDFVYPVNGQLYNYLNSNVSITQLDANIPANPYMDISAEVNLINFGIKKEKSFWTADVGFRINSDMDINRSLFFNLKQSNGTSQQINMAGASASVMASLQASLGYSRDLSDVLEGLRVGGKLRVILPIAYAGMTLDNISLTTTPDVWSLKADASLAVASKTVDVIDANGNISPELSRAGIAGFGMSFDLGAEYRFDFDGFFNSLSVSAAVTDLGFVSYGDEFSETVMATGKMEWTGADINIQQGNNGSSSGSLGQENNFFDFENVDKKLPITTLPSFYLGAELPFLENKMSVGLLFSSRKSFIKARKELTLSYNLTPINWFSAGINYSFLNTAKTLGAVIELTPKIGPCFFIGCDYLSLSKAKAPEDFFMEYVPMAWRFNFQLGLAFALGGKE